MSEVVVGKFGKRKVIVGYESEYLVMFLVEALRPFVSDTSSVLERKFGVES